MTATTHTRARRSATGPGEDARLRLCLEHEAVPRLAGRRARVTRFARSSSPAATSYGAEVVSARLAGGDELRFFLKDYGSSRRPRPGAARRRERELAVYRHLIGDGELGTARFCGAVWDDGAALHWLLLELVGGEPLRQMELRFWIEAARWLARFQARFARSPLPAEVIPLLERHDARFFAAAAESARRSVSGYSRSAARRLERVLKPYEDSIELLAGSERALVHGHYEAANLLVDAEAGAARLCPVDWELAALGSRSFDLASLCDGFRPPELHLILDAYAEAAARCGLQAPPREELERAIARLRLFRVVSWLAGAAAKRYPEAGVESLLGRGEGLTALVGA